MRIVSSTKVEDCFDGSVVYEYEFDATWDEDAVKDLARFGELEYFSDFPRPLFRVRSAGGMFVKGVSGSNRCRVIFSRKGKEEQKAAFEEVFRGHRKGGQPPGAEASNEIH